MFKRGGTTNTGIMDGFNETNTEDRVQAAAGDFMGNVQSMIGPRPERLADPSRLDELFAGVKEAATSTFIVVFALTPSPLPKTSDKAFATVDIK